MNHLASRLALPVAASMLLPLCAHAQAFRTYLASYGNDANPGCTVSAPCRLLPAALNAVVDGGEVWILDSANFNAGTVNIAKSVSILAVPGEVASIVAVANTPAINIATANVSVALRNIVVARNTGNPGTYGITMTNGAVLSVDGCLFSNLNNDAIYVHNTSSLVQFRNTVFRNIVGYAVFAQDGPTVSLANSQLLSTNGILAYGGSAALTTSVTVSDSTIADGFEGVFALANFAGSTARIMITRSTLHNLSFPLDSESGGGTAVIYAGGNMIDAAAHNWYTAGGPNASVVSYGNNQFSAGASATGSLTFNALQ